MQNHVHAAIFHKAELCSIMFMRPSFMIRGHQFEIEFKLNSKAQAPCISLAYSTPDTPEYESIYLSTHYLLPIHTTPQFTLPSNIHITSVYTSMNPVNISLKNLHLVPLSLISPKDAQLGPIIQNIWNPGENGTNPTFDPDKLNGAIRKIPVDGFITQPQTQERHLSGVLAKVISAVTSIMKKKSGQINWHKMESSALSDIKTFFKDALAQSNVQQWLAERYRSGYRKAFMITGVSVVENLRLSVVNETSIFSSGGLNVGNLVASATGLGFRAEGLAECHGSSLSGSEMEGEIKVPDEIVWAIRYRKICLKQGTAKASLNSPHTSMSKEWKMMLKTRGHTEQEILVHVELGEWDNEELKEDGYEWEEYDGEGNDMYIVPNFENSDEEEGEEEEQDEEN